MARDRSYTDSQLRSAVAECQSWRGVLREVGLVASSGSAIESVRTRAEALGIDYSHLRRREQDGGPRTESVVGMDPGVAEVDDRTECLAVDGERRLHNLNRAGSLIAAAWFTIAGFDVSWPLEPCRYDLIVCGPSGVRRVQAKTTRTRAGGTWKVYLSKSRARRVTYALSEIDDFFIVDGDLACYLIPLADVVGVHAIHLSGYQAYRLPPLLESR